MIREILQRRGFSGSKMQNWPHRQICKLPQDLLDTLIHHKEGCVGLAANMIGVNKRIIGL